MPNIHLTLNTFLSACVLGVIAAFAVGFPSLASAATYDGGGLFDGLSQASGVGVAQGDLPSFISSAIDRAVSYSTLAGLAVVVAAAFMLILGFGSEEWKDRAKKAIIYVAAGLIVLFFARIIVDFFATAGGSDISGPVLSIISMLISYSQLAALLVITVACIVLILSFGNDDRKEQAKRMIIYAVVGLVILFFAQVIVDFFASAGTYDITGVILGIISTLLFYSTILALLVIVVACIVLILSFGNEDRKEQAKRMIIYAIVGLVILFFAQVIVTFFANGGDDSLAGTIYSIIDTLIFYSTIAALLVIVVAGFVLILSFGNEDRKEQAKRMIIYAIVGLVILFFAQVIVTFFANGGDDSLAGTIYSIIDTLIFYSTIAALLVIVVAGFVLILSFGNEDRKEQAKRMILYAIIGLLVLFFAQLIVDFFSGGGLTYNISGDVQGIIDTIVSYATLAGVFVIVVAGFWLILGFGSEDAKERAKRMIIYVIVGLLVIYFAQYIVEFFFTAGTTANRSPIEQLLITITNYLALAAIITIVVAGIILILSFGNEDRKEQAKRIIYYTLAGLFIVLMARVIVMFVLNVANYV